MSTGGVLIQIKVPATRATDPVPFGTTADILNTGPTFPCPDNGIEYGTVIKMAESSRHGRKA